MCFVINLTVGIYRTYLKRWGGGVAVGERMPAERIRKYQPRAEKISDDTILTLEKREIRR